MSLESRLEGVAVANLPSASYARLPKGSTVRSAVERMRDLKFEVALIMDGDQPTAMLTPERIRQEILGAPSAWEKPVEELAQPIPGLSAAASLKDVLKQLESSPYLALIDGLKVTAVLSRAHMLRFLSGQLNFQNFNQTPETERSVRAREHAKN